MNKLRLNNVSLKFKNEEIEVLHNINLNFVSGKVYAILGNSGSGKTTLLNIIANKITNYTGDVLYNDINIKDIHKLDNRMYSNKIISYIHQQSICFEKLTIKDNLNISNLLETTENIPDPHLLNLTSEIDKKVNCLSGGEQKRINILQSINKEFEILLADEPTSNLDFENAEIVMDYLKEKSKEKIFIFVTHNKEIANKYADEILEIKNHHINKNKLVKTQKEITSEPKTPKELSNKKAFSCAKKFTSSEKTTNRLFISSMIIMMFTIIVIGSLSLGLKKYFINQVESSSIPTSITLSTNNSYEIISDEELNELSQNYPNDNIFFMYNNQNNIIANLNEQELIIPSWSINTPFKYCENLKENELVLTINDDYKQYIEAILGIDDIEDYMIDNQLCLEFNLNNKDYQFYIKDIIFDEIEEILQINANDPNLYHSFHSINSTKLVVVEQESISNDLLNFMNSTENYIFNTYDKYVIFNKTQKYVVNYNKLKQSYNNVVPIIKNNTDFWLNYYNGVLYFNDTELLNKEYKIEDTIFYLPYIEQSLVVGRYPENFDEIVISKAIYNKLNIDSLYDNVQLKFKDEIRTYKVVGVVEKDENYIYQNGAWIVDQYKKMYPKLSYLFKTTEYLIIEYPNMINDIVQELKENYPEYNVYSYVSETLENVDSIVNIIIVIGFITVIVLALISLISIIVLSKIEKDNYKKQIQNLYNFGLNTNDINNIYKKIFLQRELKSSLLIIIYASLFIYTVNTYLKNENIFNDSLFSYNPLIFIIALTFSSIIFLTSYLLVRIRDQKTPV